MVYANGGHDQPLWYHADTGENSWLDAPGMLLGVFGEVRMEETKIETQPGDILVFYTDGITETRRDDGDFYGDERLSAVVKATTDNCPQHILDSIVESVEKFGAGIPPSDDLTLFVIKRQSVVSEVKYWK